MNRIVVRRLATTIGAACFLLVMAGAGLMAGWLFSQRPPLVLRNVHETDGVVIRGGWLDLDFTLTRMRDCDARVERWLWQDDTDGARRWVPMQAVANPPTALGVEVHYKLSLPVPGNIPAGAWHYFSRTRDECGNVFSLVPQTVRDSGDVPVIIVDPPEDAPAQIVAPPGPVTILPSK